MFQGSVGGIFLLTYPPPTSHFWWFFPSAIPVFPCCEVLPGAVGRIHDLSLGAEIHTKPWLFGREWLHTKPTEKNTANPCGTRLKKLQFLWIEGVVYCNYTKVYLKISGWEFFFGEKTNECVSSVKKQTIRRRSSWILLLPAQSLSSKPVHSPFCFLFNDTSDDFNNTRFKRRKRQPLKTTHGSDRRTHPTVGMQPRGRNPMNVRH